uniref:Ig-like domain-containing protein n=1 Tax=Cyprinus carpio TaxID=7962 RepID=A0A8C1P7I4_CYPCA
MRNSRISVLLLKWLLIVCQSEYHICQTSAHIVLQSTRFMSVLPGDEVTLDCSMAAGVRMSSYIMYWYKQDHYGEPIQLIIKENDKPTQNYEAILNTNDNRFSLKVSKVTAQDSVTYYCAAGHSEARTAYFGNGTKLTVLERDVKEPEVEILKPSGIETRCKKTITLVCVAEKFYPDHVSITWTLGDKEIKENVATDPYATQDKTTKLFSMTSRLKVSKKEFKPKNKYRCTVNFYNGTHDISDNTDEINGIEGISLDIN